MVKGKREMVGNVGKEERAGRYAQTPVYIYSGHVMCEEHAEPFAAAEEKEEGEERDEEEGKGAAWCLRTATKKADIRSGLGRTLA